MKTSLSTCWQCGERKPDVQDADTQHPVYGLIESRACEACRIRDVRNRMLEHAELCRGMENGGRVDVMRIRRQVFEECAEMLGELLGVSA